MRLYETMFVIDSAIADRDFDGVSKEITATVEKHGGKVVDLRKWDERRLAYEINRVRRGTYILVHFEAPPTSIEQMRRDFVLSENILRQLILQDGDGVPTGDERPGITTTVADLAHARRMERRRRREEAQAAEEGGDEDEDEVEYADSDTDDTDDTDDVDDDDDVDGADDSDEED